jgi:hypothetical protein
VPGPLGVAWIVRLDGEIDGRKLTMSNDGHASRTARWDLYVTGAAVAGHFLVNAAHAVAHTVLGIDPPPGSMLFILVVTFAMPVGGFAILLRRPLLGATILATSMLASFVFGAAFHFVVDSSDRIDHVGHGLWPAAFRTTAVLLLITQILAIAAAATVSRRYVFNTRQL